MSFGASATELGLASYYGAAGLVAAHRSLPMGSRVKVLNLDNGRSVILRIMDRGPFIRGRVIDVSTAAAEAVDGGLNPRLSGAALKAGTNFAANSWRPECGAMDPCQRRKPPEAVAKGQRLQGSVAR